MLSLREDYCEEKNHFFLSSKYKNFHWWYGAIFRSRISRSEFSNERLRDSFDACRLFSIWKVAKPREEIQRHSWSVPVNGSSSSYLRTWMKETALNATLECCITAFDLRVSNTIVRVIDGVMPGFEFAESIFHASPMTFNPYIIITHEPKRERERERDGDSRMIFNCRKIASSYFDKFRYRWVHNNLIT